MPKASVDKHDNPLASENEIRLAEERDSATPAPNAGGAKQAYQTKLGAFIARATHARHPF
jgi:hypothetical protein